LEGIDRSQGSVDVWWRNIACYRSSIILQIFNINSFILSFIKKIKIIISRIAVWEPLVCAGSSVTVCGEKLIVPQLVINPPPSLNLKGSTEY
jgi:hypothetical protein